MQTNKCEKWRELISAYVDSELRPKVARQLETHLDYCPDCAERLKALQSVSNLVKRLRRRGEMRSIAHAEIIRRARLEATLRTSPVKSWYLGWKLAAVAAVACVLIVAGYLLIPSEIQAPPATDLAALNENLATDYEADIHLSAWLEEEPSRAQMLIRNLLEDEFDLETAGLSLGTDSDNWMAVNQMLESLDDEQSEVLRHLLVKRVQENSKA